MSIGFGTGRPSLYLAHNLDSVPSEESEEFSCLGSARRLILDAECARGERAAQRQTSLPLLGSGCEISSQGAETMNGEQPEGTGEEQDQDSAVESQTGANEDEKTKTTASRRKMKANRRNALRSTGPRTPAGKNVARWNALKHGLLAREIVVAAGPGQENAAEFRFLLEQLRCDLRPVGALEEILVEKIAACYWRLRRLLHSETGEVRKGLLRAVDKAASQQRIRKMVGREMTEEEEDACIETEQDCRHVPEIEVADKLLRYEMTLERGLYRALHLLERIQSRRKGEAVPPPVTVELSGIT
ncbi:MAG: hypothetical protein HW398_430 [Acidobacteria bacterium]|nr:hypothetical protein [Acidobacteriota bacterium]